MSISTSLLFDRATERMSSLQNRLATTQAQLTESKQVLSPSDAPDQAAAIQRLRGEIDRQDAHAKILDVAAARFQSEEVALTSASDLLIRLKELSIQAANDTLGPADRKSVAVEMKSLRQQLLDLTNSKDDSGNYLFSGTRVKSQAFVEQSDGTVKYMGDQSQTRIPAGVERTVAYTRSGTDVFSPPQRTLSDGSTQSVGLFESIDDLVHAVENSNTANIHRGLGEVTQMHNSMTMAIAQSGSDQSVVQSQKDMLAETTLRLKSTLSDVEDLDYTTAITRMNKEMMALQAAMGSFSKIAGMTLFDYIRN